MVALFRILTLYDVVLWGKVPLSIIYPGYDEKMVDHLLFRYVLILQLQEVELKLCKC